MVESWPPEKALFYYDVAAKIIAAENGHAEDDKSDEPDPLNEKISAALGFDL